MSLSRRNLLITGATGRIGPHVVDALVHAGYSLRLATPDPIDQAATSTWVPVDLAGDVDYDKLVSDIDVVVHLAAELWNPLKMDSVNVAATAHLASAAERAGVGLFIYTSTAAVYGFPTRTSLDETSPTLPTDECQLSHAPYLAEEFMRVYSVTKLQGEFALTNHLRNTQSIVLRLANVVTEDDIKTILKWGVLKRIWRGKRATHQVYVKDVAAVVEFFVSRYFQDGLSALAPCEIFVVSQDTVPASTYADLFRRYDRARGAVINWCWFSPPLWVDRLKDCVKFRRFGIGWPWGALSFSPEKLLGTGFEYRYKIANVQNQVIANLVGRSDA